VILLSEGFTIFNDSPHNINRFYIPYGLKMSKYANPADKLSVIAASPFSVLDINTSIVDLAGAVKT